MLSISMPRGDLVKKRIAIRDSGTGDITSSDFDDIFFTVKKAYHYPNYIFQKRYSTGEIVKGEDGYYYLTIKPEDTDLLAFGTYDFDIELYKQDEIKQTTTGKLIITQEVTYASNEG